MVEQILLVSNSLNVCEKIVNGNLIEKIKLFDIMNLSPINQTNLFSLGNYLLEFIDFIKKKLPTKILLSGDKLSNQL